MLEPEKQCSRHPVGFERSDGDGPMFRKDLYDNANLIKDWCKQGDDAKQDTEAKRKFVLPVAEAFAVHPDKIHLTTLHRVCQEDTRADFIAKKGPFNYPDGSDHAALLIVCDNDSTMTVNSHTIPTKRHTIPIRKGMVVYIEDCRAMIEWKGVVAYWVMFISQA